MKIDFQITDVPPIFDSRNLISYTEGHLDIFIDSFLAFSQPGILLIEFAISSKEWLKKIKSGQMSDLVFESMDFDEPIMCITHKVNNYFQFSSIWQENEVRQLISIDDLIKAFDFYIAELSTFFKYKFEVDISNMLK